ncbi:MAG: DNA helicase PcrA [Eubacteriales bacterium]
MSDLYTKITAGLNERQVEAVTAGPGPVCVLAGAGSGKTTVLVRRIQYLLAFGTGGNNPMPPHRILAITFTNKAAGEMRERVEALVPGAARELWVSTFHAACARILRRQDEFFGRTRDFVIYDTEDQRTVVRDCLRQLNADSKKYLPQAVAAVISAAKNQMSGVDEYAAAAEGPYEQVVAKAYRLYQDTLLRNNAVDFDDLLILTVRLFQEYPAVLEHYRGRFRYILVDEYQDTNRAQYLLANLLAGESRNLFVVGDPDQSIYSWRGADIRNILSFERDYPEARVIKLEQNYRSTGSILDTANHIINNNEDRRDKHLWTAAGPGASPVLYRAYNEREEAAFVANRISKIKAREGRPYREFAVLYRTNAMSRALEEAFVLSGLPYVVFGGTRFYDRKEIRDVMAYLRLIVNPWDAVSLARVINVSGRGIGPASLGRILAFARELGISPVEALAKAGEISGLTSVARTAAAALGNLILRLAGLADDMPVTELTRTLLEETGYRQELIEERTVEARTRLEYLDEFLSVTGEYDLNSEETGLSNFLESVALVADIDRYDEEADRVVLMTLHSAKGLEFPVVFMVGLEEGIFPHSRSQTDPAELEEERRLCYVGITRAGTRLYLTNCLSRTLYGLARQNPVSRFIKEIPPELLAEDDGLDVEASGRPGGGQPARQRTEEWGHTDTNVPKSRKDGRGSAPAGTRGGFKADLEAGKLQKERQANVYTLGDKVRHVKWGVGVVVGAQGKGEETELKVAFPDQGIKLLLVKYAPLEKVK